jgi:hypothetical protein
MGGLYPPMQSGTLNFGDSTQGYKTDCILLLYTINLISLFLNPVHIDGVHGNTAAIFLL